MERRDFLKSAVLGTAAGGTVADAETTIPKRKYKDDVELSIVGFGGIVVVGMEQKDADAEVARAFERGVNYYDVAPSYFDGEAETKLGNALRPYRAKSFLACKTMKRDAQGAREELEQSLRRLRTDHFDLYQFHAVTKMEEVEQIIGPGGAAETFLKARQEGKVKYLGCSAHSEAAALAMLDRFRLDSILFPINFVSFTQADFGPRVITRAKEKGTARLALKALAHTRFSGPQDLARKKYTKAWYRPVEDGELARNAFRFTLSQDITAAIPPGEEKFFRMAMDFASGFEPLSAAEREELVAKARTVAPLFPLS